MEKAEIKKMRTNNEYKPIKYNEKWIFCPVCASKTRDRIRAETVLENYPLFCPKCKKETMVNIAKLKMVVSKEPDA